MALLLDLPTEICYMYAKYLNLRELYGLLKSCKEVKQRIDTDLIFQKICLEGTPASLRYKSREVRAAFQENRALIGIRNNDPSYFIFRAPNGTAAELFPMLKESTVGMFKRADLSAAMFAHDADNVLLYLIETLTKEGNNLSAADFMQFLCMLGEALLLLDDKSNPKKKTVPIVLDLLKKHRDELLKSMTESFTESSTTWFRSSMTVGVFFKALLAVQQTRPEYAWDLNEPFAGTETTPLQYTAKLGANKMFELLLEAGAAFKTTDPYLPLLYHYFGVGRDKLRKKFCELGADINVPLPPSVVPVPTSILYSALNNNSSVWLIEHLLYKGAKLLKHEEEICLLEPGIKQRAAQCQLQDNYNPFDSTEEYVIKFGARDALSFSCHESSSCALFKNGNFALTDGHRTFYSGNKYVGDWRQSMGKLILRATQTVSMGYSSYEGPFEYNTNIDPEVMTFSIIKTVNDDLAIADEEIDDIEQKINSLMILKPI